MFLLIIIHLCLYILISTFVFTILSFFHCY
nr:MAG TPA: hypothetical protein [Caudoviricetes sp.]